MRKQAGRSPQPTAGILDSQSVKSDVQAETRGYDANKKVKGRKRHLLVDTLGLVLVAWISSADVQDRDATAAVLPLAAEQFPTLQEGMGGLRPTRGRASSAWLSKPEWRWRW